MLCRGTFLLLHRSIGRAAALRNEHEVFLSCMTTSEVPKARKDVIDRKTNSSSNKLHVIKETIKELEQDFSSLGQFERRLAAVEKAVGEVSKLQAEANKLQVDANRLRALEFGARNAQLLDAFFNSRYGGLRDNEPGYLMLVQRILMTFRRDKPSRWTFEYHEERERVDTFDKRITLVNAIAFLTGEAPRMTFRIDGDRDGVDHEDCGLDDAVYGKKRKWTIWYV